jgi:hypothetical protein
MLVAKDHALSLWCETRFEVRLEKSASGVPYVVLDFGRILKQINPSHLGGCAPKTDQSKKDWIRARCMRLLLQVEASFLQTGMTESSHPRMVQHHIA